MPLPGGPLFVGLVMGFGLGLAAGLRLLPRLRFGRPRGSSGRSPATGRSGGWVDGEYFESLQRDLEDRRGP